MLLSWIEASRDKLAGMNICRVKRLFNLIITGLLVGLSGSSQAEVQVKSFYRDSFQIITEYYQGKPFIVSLWSLDCPPCAKELRSLASWKQQYPELNLVLISTDGSAFSKEVGRYLMETGLTAANTWVFAEESAAHLRYSIDPQWYGELPRSYLYNAAHQATAISGILKEETFRLWAEKNRI